MVWAWGRLGIKYIALKKVPHFLNLEENVFNWKKWTFIAIIYMKQYNLCQVGCMQFFTAVVQGVPTNMRIKRRDLKVVFDFKTEAVRRTSFPKCGRSFFLFDLIWFIYEICTNFEISPSTLKMQKWQTNSWEQAFSLLVV